MFCRQLSSALISHSKSDRDGVSKKKEEGGKRGKGKGGLETERDESMQNEYTVASVALLLLLCVGNLCISIPMERGENLLSLSLSIVSTGRSIRDCALAL